MADDGVRLVKERLKNLPVWRYLVGCRHRLKEMPPMPKQPAIPGLRDAMKKKVTRREQFLADMD